MMVQIVGYIAVALVLFVVVRSLRNGQISERYAILWLILSLAVLVVLIFPDILVFFADILGIAVPSNLLFIVSLGLLTAIALHLTWEQSRSEQRIRRLAEEIAILNARVADAEGRLHSQSGNEIRPKGSDSQGEAP